VLVQPVVAAGVGWLAFSERITPVQALGAAVLLAGVVLAQASRERRRAAPRLERRPSEKAEAERSQTSLRFTAAVLPRSFRDFEAELLAFVQAAHARLFDRADVDEHVRAAVVRGDEAEALGPVEPFHRAGIHCRVSSLFRADAPERRRVSQTNVGEAASPGRGQRLRPLVTGGRLGIAALVRPKHVDQGAP
jgi:hypothetical protein